MGNPRTDQLKEMGAKYVFCMMTDTIIVNLQTRQPSLVVPKYTIGWTDMEIRDAPTTATIKLNVLDGMSIMSFNEQLINLHLIEKL